MIRYKLAIAGNRYEIIIADTFYYALYDKTLQEVIAESTNPDELILYAQHNNMINADAVVIQ